MTQPYPGFNIILLGPSGTGKTHSIATLCETGLEVFCLFLEPGLETLIGAFVDRGQPLPSNLHWHYLAPKTQGFDQLRSTAEFIGKFDQKAIANMADNTRGTNNQVVSMLEVLNNFTDQKDGKSYGPVDSWDATRVIVIDSLSALNDIMFSMVVGTRPMRSVSDYGIAQTNLMNLIKRLTNGCLCHFVLVAHVERLTDEIMGGVKLMPVTIGQATKSTLPIPFSDVILTVRTGTEFSWDTANSQADLKTRNLPIANKLPPSFVPVVQTWKKRKDAAQNTLSSSGTRPGDHS